MRVAIFSLLLFFFSGCTITTYQQHQLDPIFTEEYHDPVRIMIYPTPRYGSYYYRNSYIHRPLVRVPKHYHYHNGIRVHKKNYWSKTTKHPQPKKESTTERRHNWRHRRKQQNSKGR